MIHTDPAFLMLNDVSLTFVDNDERVLAGVSLTVPAGAFAALVGTSGVGKSTLLRLIAGLLPPSSGTVTLQGINPTQSAAPIGIVFQRDNLLPWRTVYDNVRLPLELAGDNGRAAEQVNEMLTLVGLEGYSAGYPAQLSGGMAQRVAIARALIHRPALLLLDEPFGALDALTRERMAQELLRIWQAMPVTVLMVTHSISEAVLLADEVLVMNGRPATITDRIDITLPRPRHLDVQATIEFQAYVAAVRGAIREITKPGVLQ
jgi:NitT/TauT family transport system ATP-binding protein